MPQSEIDALTDEEWATYWNDLLWLRKDEKDESLNGLKKLGLM